MHVKSLILLALWSATVLAAPTGPTIVVDEGVLLGVTKGTVNQFLGIPYAKPPCVPATIFLPYKQLKSYIG